MVDTAVGGASASTPARDAGLLERALFEVKRVIVGQDRMVERMLVCLLAKGHCLLEGVPGVAKTLAVETLATVAGGTFARLQFTPDLVPSDIVGTRIFKPGSDRFDTELGPVFANFVLTDEINRIAKTTEFNTKTLLDGTLGALISTDDYTKVRAAVTVVDDLDTQCALAIRDGHPAVGGVTVLGHVGERLGHREIRGVLHRRIRPATGLAQSGIDRQLHRDGTPTGESGERTGQTTIAEYRRCDAAGQRAQLVESVPGLGDCLVQRLP